jgi:fused-like protein
MSRKEDYQIVGLIGQGAFGQVFKARRKGSSQVVAIKTINKRGKSEHELANIRTEIDILRKLRHENIILLLDSF